MEFRFETDYDQETLTAMARGLRKTVRRKRSRRTHIFAGIVLVIGLASTVLSIASKEPLRARNLLVPLAMLCVIYASLQEDRLNRRVAKRNVLPGTEHAGCVFGEDGYTIKTSVTESKFSYAQIRAVAEMPRYLVLALSNNQAQAFDKESLSGGTIEEFRAFLAEKTGKPIQMIK